MLGDLDMITQALYNLIENALRYTPEGGKVEVSLRDLGKHVEIAVKDTGEGIAEDNLAKIFDKFYRTDQARSAESGGSGIGLAIVKKVMDLHDTEIYVDSKEGSGTCFRFSLPKTPIVD